MCGINIFNILNTTIEEVNYHCQKRGPDYTNILFNHGITFIHNLLSITGNKTIQPFQKNNIICLFNGEIYNYKDIEINNEKKNYNSDGECIIDLYLNYGLHFHSKLDGEFAIVIFDFNISKCYTITDPMGTKPLFYSLLDNGRFMFSSYSRCLEVNKMEKIKKIKANTLITFELIKINTTNNDFGLKYINEINLWKFDLHQYKTNYDDWIKQFEKSIEKRVANLKKPLFVSLSSGYDSGAICCTLNKLNKKYETFTIKGKEDINVLKNRFEINKKCGNHSNIFFLNEDLILKEKQRNEKECSNYIKNIKRNNPDKQYSVLRDRALNGGGYIAKHAKEKGYIVCLSGQGADEILSDYGFNGQKKTWHSCFGGLFPNNLNNIINQDNIEESIWESFQDGINEALIMKEESIYGSYGIETRYPFLDKDLIQEFLWLSPELKNNAFKAPLYYYLTNNNYPFKKNEKIGLNCLY